MGRGAEGLVLEHSLLLHPGLLWLFRGGYR
jgi:hypothetical protein